MRIPENVLLEAARDILERLGEDKAGAETAARYLVRADMRGVSTHGINLLRLVALRADAGMLALPTRVTVVSDDAATAVLDGGNGLGPVAAQKALDTAVRKAAEYGIGMAALRNTNNIGALGCFTREAARKGYIAVVTTNGNPSVAPFGAADPFFGTNPISFAIPRGGREPIVLDMSSSIVARGKIRLASLGGEPIPEGWALDSEGNPTTDPKKALKGCLLPLGGAKGSGLAMIVDILSGMLSGSAYGRKLRSFHELDGPTGVGATFICVDIGRFLSPAAFEASILEYADQVKALRRQPGFGEILLPGEVESNKESDSARAGVEVPEAVIKEIDGVAEKLGCPIRLGGSA